jgi:Domain of unknown function (DUF1990)
MSAPSTPASARIGWLARVRGLLKQFFNPARESVITLPAAPVMPAELMDAQVQLEGEGFGKLLGRRYEVVFKSALQPTQLMARVMQNLDQLSPEELASFEKTQGSSWVLKLGDEFEITILGPWNGRVRVIEVAADAFSFVTLQGHPEAGRIRFAVQRTKPGIVRFNITSWARSRDGLVDLTYDKLNVGKNIQTTAWQTFLERVVELGNGRQVGKIEVSEQPLEENHGLPKGKTND